MMEGTLITNKEARGWRVLAGRRVSSFQFYIYSRCLIFSASSNSDVSISPGGAPENQTSPDVATVNP